MEDINYKNKYYKYKKKYLKEKLSGGYSIINKVVDYTFKNDGCITKLRNLNMGITHICKVTGRKFDDVNKMITTYLDSIQIIYKICRIIMLISSVFEDREKKIKHFIDEEVTKLGVVYDQSFFDNFFNLDITHNFFYIDNKYKLIDDNGIKYLILYIIYNKACRYNYL